MSTITTHTLFHSFLSLSLPHSLSSLFFSFLGYQTTAQRHYLWSLPNSHLMPFVVMTMYGFNFKLNFNKCHYTPTTKPLASTIRIIMFTVDWIKRFTKWRMTVLLFLFVLAKCRRLDGKYRGGEESEENRRSVQSGRRNDAHYFIAFFNAKDVFNHAEQNAFNFWEPLFSSRNFQQPR